MNLNWKFKDLSKGFLSYNGNFSDHCMIISWSLERYKHPVQGQSARVYCPVQTGDREIKMYLKVIILF